MNYRELESVAPYHAWAASYKEAVDVKNRAILAIRQKALDSRTDIGVGDIVLDGEKTFRVAHIWTEDVIQLTDGTYGASFYLGADGFVDYSGGLNPGIARDRFTPTKERRDAPVWFFSEDYVTAHNGYRTEAFFRVWTLSPKSQITEGH